MCSDGRKNSTLFSTLPYLRHYKSKRNPLIDKRWRYCDSQKQANIQYVFELWYLPLTIYCREYQIPLTIRIKLVCDTSMDFDSFIDRLIYCFGYQIKMTVRRKLICDISMHFDSFINRIFYRCEYHIKVTVKKSL